MSISVSVFTELLDTPAVLVSGMLCPWAALLDVCVWVSVSMATETLVAVADLAGNVFVKATHFGAPSQFSEI
jgi:hypothetical protein